MGCSRSTRLCPSTKIKVNLDDFTGIVHIFANPSKRGASPAIFNWTRQGLSCSGEGCTVRVKVAP